MMRQFADLLLPIVVGLLLVKFVGPLFAPLTPAEKVYLDLDRRGIKFPIVVMAQVALETGFLSTRLSNECFNYWGIKPHTKKEKATWTIHACFTSQEEAWTRFLSFQQIRMRDYEKYKRPIRTTEDYHDFLECMIIPKYGIDNCFRYAEDLKYISKISRLEEVISGQINQIKVELWKFYYLYRERRDF